MPALRLPPAAGLPCRAAARAWRALAGRARLTIVFTQKTSADDRCIAEMMTWLQSNTREAALSTRREPHAQQQEIRSMM
jgi:hypothetical protein